MRKKKRTMPKNATWTTRSEVTYVRRIGQETEDPTLSKKDRLLRKMRLLRLYIQAARLRSDWGDIEPRTVVFEAKTQLLKLQRQLTV
jgi:hypothetical protein